MIILLRLPRRTTRRGRFVQPGHDFGSDRASKRLLARDLERLSERRVELLLT